MALSIRGYEVINKCCMDTNRMDMRREGGVWVTVS